MALQVALSRLRHAKDGAQEKQDEQEFVTQPLKPTTDFEPSASSVPLFSVDEVELFNFSDDDFLGDCDDPSHPPLPPSPPPSTSSSAASTSAAVTTDNPARGSKNEEATLLETHQPREDSSKCHPSSLHGLNTSSLTPSTHSSQSSCGSTDSSTSTKTREKLRNFQFVKVSKSTSVHPSKRPSADVQSDVTPPPSKRRPVCNDVTNCGPIKCKNSTTGSDTSTAITHRDHTFKPPLFNPRVGLNSSAISSSSSITYSPSDPNKGQRPKVTTDRTQTAISCNSASSTRSDGTVYTPVATPSRSSPNDLPSVLRTPSRSSNVSAPSSNVTSTPLSSSLPNSQRVLTTPQMPGHMMRTPTRGRQTTPLVSTPTGSVATPISRGSMPIRRRFPGPAGLLPSLVPGQSMDNLYIPPPSTPTPASTPREQKLSYSTPSLSSDVPASQCAQEDISIFTQSPWTDMLTDLDLNDEESSTLLQYNIASALKQASGKQLKNGKVIHLRSVIKSIVPAGKNASAVLKDPTGEVMCTIHSRVVEDYQKDLHPGAVLILRQVSVFSPCPRKYYFNITPSNIVRIYSAHSSDAEKQPRLPLTFSDVVGEDMDEDTNILSQCTPSLRDSNYSTPSHRNATSGTLSQTEHTTKDHWIHDLQQKDNSIQINNRTVIPRQSNNIQSLTRGAAVVLATCKASSQSSFNAASKSHTRSASDTMAESVPIGCPDEMVMDDLPCDFNDFSDDERMDDVPSPVLDKGNPSSAVVNRRETCSTMVKDGTTMAPNSRDSGFFSKLCEDEFDTLFNDISNDGLDF